jgi:hypothetical protein
MEHWPLKAFREVDGYLVCSCGNGGFAGNLPLLNRYSRNFADNVLEGETFEVTVDEERAERAFSS